ncbi:glutaredoxin family protein [Gammaproteobacteria bacterium]|nr:glutaredoxin family protein [Gammaproteobacteria bacterium]
MKKLFLYTTTACHLCETAKEIITPFLEQKHLELCCVEITESDELINKYGVRIPVVSIEENKTGLLQEIEWPFNAQEFQRFIEKNASSS